MSTSTEERLEELLDQKDQELEEANQKVYELESELDNIKRMQDWAWCYHSKMKDADGLPLPRLELRVEEDKVDFLTSISQSIFQIYLKIFLGKDLVVEAEEGEERTIEVQI